MDQGFHEAINKFMLTGYSLTIKNNNNQLYYRGILQIEKLIYKNAIIESVNLKNDRLTFVNLTFAENLLFIAEEKKILLFLYVCVCVL